MKRPQVLIAIPCYGGQLQDSLANSLYFIGKKYQSYYGIETDLMLVQNESLISTGRQNIANMFLNDTTHDYLMCIDSDIGFHWEAIYNLLTHQKEFVTAAYQMKVVPPKYNFVLHPSCETDNTLVRLNHIGTGFQLVHRTVFEDIANDFPELKYEPSEVHRPVQEKNKNNSYHYYQTMIDGGIIPEDISFCRRYNTTGGKIWLDPYIELTHCGNHIFDGIPNLGESIHETIKGTK